jgi:hypothetical protein
MIRRFCSRGDSGDRGRAELSNPTPYRAQEYKSGEEIAAVKSRFTAVIERSIMAPWKFRGRMHRHTIVSRPGCIWSPQALI